jgi:FAD synthase
MLGRNMTMKGLPYFTVGKVVKGFGRGSKDLGIPTGALNLGWCLE